MSEENISQEFRLKNIDETRNYLIEEINQNELISKKPKKVYRVLNYINLIALTDINFLSWYSYRNFEFCNRIKNLCNNCRN